MQIWHLSQRCHLYLTIKSILFFSRSWMIWCLYSFFLWLQVAFLSSLISYITLASSMVSSNEQATKGHVIDYFFNVSCMKKVIEIILHATMQGCGTETTLMVASGFEVMDGPRSGDSDHSISTQVCVSCVFSCRVQTYDMKCLCLNFFFFWGGGRPCGVLQCLLQIFLDLVQLHLKFRIFLSCFSSLRLLYPFPPWKCWYISGALVLATLLMVFPKSLCKKLELSSISSLFTQRK